MKEILKMLMVLPGILGLSVAQAGIIYSTGFEQPAFVTGDLLGQDGWSADASNVIVQTSNVAYGDQAVLITPDTVNLGYGASRGINQDASDKVLTISIYSYLSTASTSAFWTVLATNLGSDYLHVNIGNNGNILLNVSGVTNFDTGVTAALDQWNRFDLIADFGNDMVDMFYNANKLVSDVPISFSNETVSNVAFYGQHNPVISPNQLAYFDNLSLSISNSSAVPEPPTAVLLLPMIAGLIKRAALGRNRSRVRKIKKD